MFYIAKDNLPFRRARNDRRALKSSAKDNTKMVVGLAESISDVSSIVKDLSMQVVELNELVAALADGSDDEEEEAEEA